MPVRSFHSHFICAVASRRSCGLFHRVLTLFHTFWLPTRLIKVALATKNILGMVISIRSLSSLSIGSERERAHSRFCIP